MVEYLAVNQAVIGSSPITSAIFEGGVETIDTRHILITDGGAIASTETLHIRWIDKHRICRNKNMRRLKSACAEVMYRPSNFICRWQTRNAAVSKTALCGSVTHPTCQLTYSVVPSP